MRSFVLCMLAFAICVLLAIDAREPVVVQEETRSEAVALTMFVLGFFLGLPLIAGLLTGFSIVKLRLKVTQYTSIVLAACFMTGAATFVQYSELLPWYLDVEPSEFRERLTSKTQELTDYHHMKTYLFIILLLVASICIMEGSINFVIEHYRQIALHHQFLAQKAALALIEANERRLGILQRRYEHLQYLINRNQGWNHIDPVDSSHTGMPQQAHDFR